MGAGCYAHRLGHRALIVQVKDDKGEAVILGQCNGRHIHDLEVLFNNIIVF